jgi:acyl-CoA synthetase (AMP-forming)/AMP-acid ligase II
MEFVRRAAGRYASRAAVSTTLENEWTTYGALVAHAEQIHAQLGAALPPARSRAAVAISTPAGGHALVGPRVAVWATPGPAFVSAAFACYMQGAALVPLSPAQPLADLSRVLEDSGAAALVAPAGSLVAAGAAAAAASSSSSSSSSSPPPPPSALLLKDLSATHRIPLIAIEQAVARRAGGGGGGEGSGDGDGGKQPSAHSSNKNSNTNDKAAIIIYTSGSTGRPKGVVYSARGLLSQSEGLARAWGVASSGRSGSSDTVLHPGLPLHHVHGLVNALHSPLSAGARVKMLVPRFSAKGAWAALAEAAAAEEQEEEGGGWGAAATATGRRRRRRNLVFHAVPTMYSIMLEELVRAKQKQEQQQQGGSEAAEAAAAVLQGARAARERARLFVCGSAACAPSLWSRWREETGHALLERYGMTEAGMILSNPLTGRDLRPGLGGGGGFTAAAVESLAPRSDDDDGDNEDEDGAIRRPGCVGLPLPDVDVRLVPLPHDLEGAAAGGAVAPASESATPEAAALTVAEALRLEQEEQEDAQQQPRRERYYDLRVRGPALFAGYWRRPDATAEAFVRCSGGGGGGGGKGGGGRGGGGDFFFETGDVVAFGRGGNGGASAAPPPPYLRVVGRASADIIKPRGFKVSALDVEAALLELSRQKEGGSGGDGRGGGSVPPPIVQVSECAVFGVPDPRYEGEEVVAALVRMGESVADDASLAACPAAEAAERLSRALAERLPAYSLPRVWLLLPPGEPIPRNAMGKFNKRALRAALFGGGPEGGGGGGGGSGSAEGQQRLVTRWVSARDCGGGGGGGGAR